MGKSHINQLSFDELLVNDKELILCQLSSSFHWIRITCGHTPREVASKAHFTLHGYDYFYEDTPGKDEIVSRFSGPVKNLSWEEGIDYDGIRD